MKHKGMTLVELMVAMTIGLGITLAISSVLIASENHKRVTTSTNDAQQTGSYGYYALDKALRGAGSSIAGSAFPTDVGVLGCHLNAGAIFPRLTPFPAPFAGFLGGAASTLNVAPVLIGKGQSQGGSDVIMVMSGSGSAGGVSRQITGGGSAIAASLDNIVGFANNDLLLVSQSGVPDCLMEEVSTVTPPTPTLNLGGIYYTANSATASMAALAGNTASYVTPLGNAVANNVQFTLYGVDGNRTLNSYDLLRNLQLVGGAGADTAQAIADGIVQMTALYGIDTNGDGIQDEWADPGLAGAWDIGTVMNSSVKMKQIVSLRVALVVRGEYYDLNGGTAAVPIPVTPPTLTVFNGLHSGPNGTGALLAQVIPVSASEQQFRYRVFEFTVPLRNMLLLAGGP
ncbi:MAG TPA: PilW family protein [Steroidobacteraceae bacterium]|jgi:type IV pilus assembly protein PilW|nr:PilW family protein [Steroidobacteraceae bacterium]